MEHYEVAIVGGGCVGLSVAAHLGMKGAGSRVVLLERAGVGEGTTASSSATIRGNYSHPTLAVLAKAALDRFAAFEAIYGADVSFRKTGYLAYFGPGDAEAAASNVAMQREMGLATYLIDEAEIAKRAPGVSVEGIAGAICEDEAGYAEPSQVVDAFHRIAQSRGVKVLQHQPVHELVRTGSRYELRTDEQTITADTILLATNAWTNKLLTTVGAEPLPLLSTRHQIAQLVFPGASHILRHVLVDMVDQFYIRPETGNRALLGSSRTEDSHNEADPDRYRRRVDESYIEDCAEYLAHRYPDWVEVNITNGYCGIYDVTPDWQPLVGAVPGHNNLIVACGFSGHGFKHSPVLGEKLADVLLGLNSFEELAIFDPSRFAENNPILAHHPYRGGLAYR